MGLGVAAAALKVEAVPTAWNLSPAAWAHIDVWALRALVVAAMLAVLWLVRVDGAAFSVVLLLACFWVPNMYADWFLMPMLGLTAWWSERATASVGSKVPFAPRDR